MDVVKANLFIIIYMLPLCIIIAVQFIRFLCADSEYKNSYKNYMSLLTDYGKKIKKVQSSVSPSQPATISFANETIEDDSFSNDGGRMLLLRLKGNDPYEWFISYKNTKIELFKSYVVAPLEIYFYTVFMISVIYALGYGIKIYFNDPLQGLGNLIEEAHHYWIGALIMLAMFLHRIVLKKIEDIKKFKDAEFKTEK